MWSEPTAALTRSLLAMWRPREVPVDVSELYMLRVAERSVAWWTAQRGQRPGVEWWWASLGARFGAPTGTYDPACRA